MLLMYLANFGYICINLILFLFPKLIPHAFFQQESMSSLLRMVPKLVGVILMFTRMRMANGKYPIIIPRSCQSQPLPLIRRLRS